MRKYKLMLKLTDLGRPGKEILKKDLPELMKKAKEKNIPIVGLPGIEPGILKPQQNFYLITTEEKKDREAFEKESREYAKIRDTCHRFLSQMYSHDLWAVIYRLVGYEERKEAVEKACKKLKDNEDRMSYMQVEFVTMDMQAMAFSIGYVMGQLYDVKDRKYYNEIKDFVTKEILAFVPYVRRKKAA